MRKLDKHIIQPVVLAGGKGTRLWPLSRATYPKQFNFLIEELSLFQNTCRRFNSNNKLSFEPIITLTNNEYRFIVLEQLKFINNSLGPIFIEPEYKSTAASILLAAFFFIKQNVDGYLLVVPSDHVIDEEKFLEAVNLAVDNYNDEEAILFGVEPSHPSTSFGYLQLENKKNTNLFKLEKFVEKPSKEIAAGYLEDGNFLWNSGIFLFKAENLIGAFKKYYPKIVEHVYNALEKSEKDLDFIRIDPGHWKKCDEISIDYAVMEKAKELGCVLLKSKWNDLGIWESIWSEKKDENKSGNVLSENVTAIDCKNSLIRSESDGQEVVGIGLENIVGVAMHDAVLIADMSRTNDVNKAVFELRKKKASQAEVFPKVFRPWGWFESLVKGPKFQVKRIVVSPKASLSLQSHRFRSEHWVVVEGEARATVGKKVTVLKQGQSIFVPSGEVHRLENTTKKNMTLIEVQIGDYLGEDDIKRFKDIYNRN